MLVADALRLGGAILGNHPDMLAPQLIGRLLPEIGANVNVRMLLQPFLIFNAFSLFHTKD